MALTPEEEIAAEAAKEFQNLNDQVEARQVLSGLTKQQLENIKKSETQLKEITTALQKQIDAQLMLAKIEKDRADAAARNASTAAGKLEAELSAGKAALELSEKQLKAGNIGDKELTKAREQYKALEEQTEKVREVTDELYNSFENLLKGNLTAGLKGLGKSIYKTIGPKTMGTVRDGLLKVVSTIGKGGAAGGGMLAGLAGFAAALIVVAVALTLFKKVFDLAIQVADATFEFMKITGASEEFASSLITVGNEARAFGGTVKEVSASFQSLFANVSDFTMMSKSAREELIKTNTVLSKLGISNDDLAKSQQNLIKAMGQSAEQAAATSRELAALAMDIGVAPSKMASDFAAAGGQLAKFGRDGVKAFKDLAQTSKITGIEVNRLLAITEKFDTFDGAAEQAGRLNAALGGNFVNAMELLTETDPTKRFEQMTGAIKDAGKSFDEMTYFEAKFFAEAMGLQDVNELALALSGNMDMVGKFTKKSSAEYEVLAARAAKVQSFQEKMNTLMAQLIPIVEPLVDFLMVMSDWMMENLQVVKLGFSLLIGLTAVLAGAMTGLAISTMIALSPFWAIAAAIGAVVAAVAALGTILFVYAWGSDFGDAMAETGNQVAGTASNFTFLAEQMAGATEAIDKFGNTTFKGSTNLKVGTEMTTRSIQDMNMAMKDASVGSASATTEANAYTMSQVGDTITTNTQNYMGNRDPINVNLNVDGKKMAQASLGPMLQMAGQR